MITTRQHGAIDYAVAALLGGLATSRRLPATVRATLGTASLFHTGYAVQTDYEAGLSPKLTMRQHLAYDALGGVALLGAGLLMRRQPASARALLVALGLSELTVVALSRPEPGSGPGGAPPTTVSATRLPDCPTVPAGEAGYPPLDTPKPFAEGMHMVDSTLQGRVGRHVPARMMAVALPDGSLLLHSPTHYTPALRRALESLGPIRHLVAPNVVHWTFLKAWQNACPDATTWAAPGLRERSQVRRSGVRLDRDLSDTPPPEWGGAIELVTVSGGFGFHEVALFHRPSRTLLLTDLVLNLETNKLPAALRPLAYMLGVVAPDGMPPPYLRAVVKMRREEASRAAARLVGFEPERVTFAHGRPFERDGAAALRRSLRWLLD